MLPALLVIGEQASLIAGTHLAHLDAGTVEGGEIAHQAPEVHPVIRHEEDCQELSAQDRLHIHDRHGELETSGPLAGVVEELSDPRLDFLLSQEIVSGRQA